MFQIAPGVTLPFPEQFQEQFQVYEGRAIQANISFEKLQPLLTEFYQGLPEPLFFVLQLPLTEQEEQQLEQKGWHDEVCYLDGQTRDQIDAILQEYGQILLEDGMSQFAVSSHVNHEEIFIQKYKLTDLYSPSPRRFIPLLQRYGLTETEHLVTPWDTFSIKTPGECRCVSIDGVDVYTIAERLKQQGLYRAKILEA